MSAVVHGFTSEIPEWVSRLSLIDLETATAEQRDALAITPSNMKVSDYLLTLAHDPQTLKHRSVLFNAIMYGKGGLARSERELGAMGASLVNRCIYCMAVHASRFTTLTKRPEVVDAIFRDGEGAELEPRMRLVFDFALKLSASPVAATVEDMEVLLRAGLSHLEIHDLIQSVALFGWANRLMHSLGDPVRTDVSEPEPEK